MRRRRRRHGFAFRLSAIGLVRREATAVELVHGMSGRRLGKVPVIGVEKMQHDGKEESQRDYELDAVDFSHLFAVYCTLGTKDRQ